MSELEVLENVGTSAVHRLREKVLASGQSFMINVEGLPKGQCYIEYPDGEIQLVVLQDGQNDFTLIKELSLPEAELLKKQVGLS